MGPSKKTPERIERILSAIRGGNTIRAACGAGGITPDTFAAWRRADPHLRDDVIAAAAAAEFAAVKVIWDEVEDWRAAAWWLERRYPEEYGRADRLRLEAAAAAVGPTQPLRITLNIGDGSAVEDDADDTAPVGSKQEDDDNLKALFPGEAAAAPTPRERPATGRRPETTR